MLPLVSAQRHEQALRYKHTLGQYCCLKSWLMLQELSAISLQHSEFLYNEHGKPFIHHTPYTIHFSISHCKTGIAVAVDNKPIGIDIEAIRHADDELVARTMNADERLAIRDDRDFIRFWTQKEAVVKMRGVGIQSFEQLQGILSRSRDHEITRPRIDTFEKANYIYSIAYE